MGHANILNIPVFDRGYGKSPSVVAKAALVQAKNDNIDVVLIDTAGRMQDNEPLMASLSKLVNENNPNLVLFVGEALAGNDSIDQLMKFDRSLYDQASIFGRSKRAIDGVLLTKFDTVDDKVGTALSMVYNTNKPIV